MRAKRKIKPNGRTCQACSVELVGNQAKYCSSNCRSRAYYTRRDKKMPTKERYIYSRLASCRSRAHKRGLPFDLTYGDIEKVIYSPCVYCNSPPMSEFDKKDSQLGYTKDNIAPACRRCNTLKNKHITYDEMIQIAQFLGWWQE